MDSPKLCVFLDNTGIPEHICSGMPVYIDMLYIKLKLNIIAHWLTDTTTVTRWA